MERAKKVGEGTDLWRINTLNMSDIWAIKGDISTPDILVMLTRTKTLKPINICINIFKKVVTIFV
jgi:hypothetical protein